MSPLLIAAFEGKVQVCEILLENNADMDHADKVVTDNLIDLLFYCSVIQLFDSIYLFIYCLFDGWSINFGGKPQCQLSLLIAGRGLFF